MKAVRWKIYRWSMHLAWWLCPNKSDFNLILKHGTAGFDEAKRATKEVEE